MSLKSSLLLFTIVLVNAFCLWPEHIPTPDLNDNVLHLTLVQGMVHAVERGDSPFTFWSPEIGLGQPVVRYYQPGAHAIVAAVYFALWKAVPIATVFQALKVLSLALVPLSFFYVARLLGLPLPTQIAAAAIAPLISGDAFGLDYTSYVWRGHGLFPQAVATHFLLLTIGFGWGSIRGRMPGAGGQGENQGWVIWRTISARSWILPALFLVLTFWTNLLYGYVGAVTLGLMVLVPGPRHFLPLLKIALATGFFALPKLWAWFSSPLLGVAMREGGGRQFMYDSFGAQVVLQNLFTGEILDHKRWPVLTILALLGIALTLRSVLSPASGPRHPAPVFCLLGFAVWLLLYFGRPFWGDSLRLMGIVSAFQLHRLIGPVQLFAVLLAALGLGTIWEYFRGHTSALLAGTLIFLAPAIQERRTYLTDNGEYMAIVREGFRREGPDIEKALDLAKRRGGRAYAGLPGTWGPKFAVGQVPIYTLFATHGIPNVGLVYISFTADGQKGYSFRENEVEDYRRFDVRTVIRPTDMQPLPNTELVATFGRFAVYKPTN